MKKKELKCLKCGKVFRGTCIDIIIQRGKIYDERVYYCKDCDVYYSWTEIYKYNHTENFEIMGD
jgi:hypothetical protein